MLCVFFFKQKTAYDMRISDWSSDVCSSDLRWRGADRGGQRHQSAAGATGEGGNRKRRRKVRRPDLQQARILHTRLDLQKPLNAESTPRLSAPPAPPMSAASWARVRDRRRIRRVR